MREQEIKWANKLQQVLGYEYRVLYDVCDSGMTEVWCGNVMVKRVINSEMTGKINVNEFRLQSLTWNH